MFLRFKVLLMSCQRKFSWLYAAYTALPLHHLLLYTAGQLAERKLLHFYLAYNKDKVNCLNIFQVVKNMYSCEVETKGPTYILLNLLQTYHFSISACCISNTKDI
ncbi:hypothetical protein GOODEAATRI_019402 [Goodea atripinnis]|uniref:Secreted protein n=1 Tax=Goodea atripinnis TaxID=208336 RepID=A0ABV0NEA1_9TELE